jgi:hypothetical protein
MVMQIKFLGRQMTATDVGFAIKCAIECGDVIPALVPEKARLLTLKEDQYETDFFLCLLEEGETLAPKFNDHGNFKELATFACAK